MEEITMKGKVRRNRRFVRKQQKNLSRAECREIGERVAAGEKVPAIANSLGVAVPTVYRHLQYDDLTKQALIRIQKNHLQQTLPRALQVQHDLLHDEDLFLDDPEFQYQIAKDVMAQGGLTPIQHQSIYVQQTFQQMNNYITPFVKELMDKRNREIDNFMDVEVVEKKQE